MSEQELEERRALFESVSLSEAQWTIRFGKADPSVNSAAKANGPAAKSNHR
jgi:hypothetical protein